MSHLLASQAFLSFTDLWTLWALLVTDGHMESPLGPQPIRSCSCFQKVTSLCRSHSGPKVLGLPQACRASRWGIPALRHWAAGVLWDVGINCELSVFFLACYLTKENAEPTKSQILFVAAFPQLGSGVLQACWNKDPESRVIISHPENLS